MAHMKPKKRIPESRALPPASGATLSLLLGRDADAADRVAAVMDLAAGHDRRGRSMKACGAVSTACGVAMVLLLPDAMADPQPGKVAALLLLFGLYVLMSGRAFLSLAPRLDAAERLVPSLSSTADADEREAAALAEADRGDDPDGPAVRLQAALLLDHAEWPVSYVDGERLMAKEGALESARQWAASRPDGAPDGKRAITGLMDDSYASENLGRLAWAAFTAGCAVTAWLWWADPSSLWPSGAWAVAGAVALAALSAASSLLRFRAHLWYLAFRDSLWRDAKAEAKGRRDG